MYSVKTSVGNCHLKLRCI